MEEELMSEQKKKLKFYDFRHFPMDLGRMGLAVVPLIYPARIKTPTGEKYRGRVRGGALIAANHNSFLDPLVLFLTFWYRRVYFLAGELVMTGSLKSKLMAGMGAIKIDRNIADMEAVRRCVSLLKEGHVIGIFPQGQIAKTEEVADVKHGAVLMALQAGVPIVPMYIAPQEKWYHRRNVVIGDPIDPRALCTRKIPSTADIQNISQVLITEMNRCSPKKEAVK